ncbi:MAG: 3'(2'),5'-bisphosphate nucleotidase CysQ [Desulfosarcina sp.]|nr:3'(2'),5'-bisphosphate nucleotidase CysQ [Desulfosarcina sp.]MBC2765338.1 3'(2'),5'-bisphosphate nucleotidase CysQ [Desulfosarcina sp.]
MKSRTTWLHSAIISAVAAGKAILEVYRSPDMGVEKKADDSPLTRADRQSHEIILAAINGFGIPILSEEGRDIPYAERRRWNRMWIVDPLDGTKEFIKKNGEFGTDASDNPQALDKLLGQATRLPLGKDKDRPFTVMGSRSHATPELEAYVETMRHKYGNVDFISAGSSLKICRVAEGRADVYPRLGPTMEWDTAAGQAIAVASGARVVRHDDGNALAYNKENLLNPWFVVERQ